MPATRGDMLVGKRAHPRLLLAALAHAHVPTNKIWQTMMPNFFKKGMGPQGPSLSFPRGSLTDLLRVVALFSIASISVNGVTVGGRVSATARIRTAAKVSASLEVEIQHVHNMTTAGRRRRDDKWNTCKTCVFMMERIKKGTNMLLPAICSELYLKYPDSYKDCHGLLGGINMEANNIRYWLFEGCYKYELYEAKEWIKPCPSHVICSNINGEDKKSLCDVLPPENPFMPPKKEAKK
jgi:hypothetical protein